jgi:KDO2-lipid IV(A) lauroyltransferase
MFDIHRLEYILFQLLGKIFSLFGFKRIKKTSKIIAFIGYSLLRIRKKVVFENLQTAFPNLSNSEIKKLAFRNYQSIAITFLEIINLNRMTKEGIKKHFLDSGFESIFKKFSEDKGLILLTAHFGNWEIGALATGIHLNEPIHVLVKKQKNRYVSEWLTFFRERFGNVQITLGASVRELYKAIKQRKIVGIVGDQRGKRDGVKVKFFGKDTYTFPGTAAIALRTKCHVMVMLCARQPDGKYIGEMEELRYDDIEGDEEVKIKEFNQRYMNILESAIRKYPDQWFWMHNIWKY